MKFDEKRSKIAAVELLFNLSWYFFEKEERKASDGWRLMNANNQMTAWRRVVFVRVSLSKFW